MGRVDFSSHVQSMVMQGFGSFQHEARWLSIGSVVQWKIAFSVEQSFWILADLRLHSAAMTAIRYRCLLCDQLEFVKESILLSFVKRSRFPYSCLFLFWLEFESSVFSYCL